MPKRYVDSERWKDPWYRALGANLRELRSFIFDDCDNAGIWVVDLDRAAFYTGHSFAKEDIRKCIRGRIFDLGDRIVIEEFLETQYKSYPDLRPSNNALKSVIERLYNLWISRPDQALPRAWSRTKEQEQEQDKDKAQEKEKDPQIAERCVNEVMDVDNSRLLTIQGRYERIKTAVRVCGNSDPIGAKKMIGDRDWHILKNALGGWGAVCRMKENDDFSRTAILKALNENSRSH